MKNVLWKLKTFLAKKKILSKKMVPHFTIEFDWWKSSIKVAGPIKNASCILWTQQKHISVIHQCVTRENDRSRGAIDFADRCLDSFSVYLVASNFSLRISEKLNSVSLHKKGKTTTPPQRFLRDLKAWEITPRRCFLYWEQFFLNTLGKILGNYSLWRMNSLTLQVQLYWNCFPYWICFLEYAPRI